MVIIPTHSTMTKKNSANVAVAVAAFAAAAAIAIVHNALKWCTATNNGTCCGVFSLYISERSNWYWSFLEGENKFMCRSSLFVVKIKRINVIYFTLFAGRNYGRATSIEWKYISFIFSVDIFLYPFQFLLGILFFFAVIFFGIFFLSSAVLFFFVSLFCVHFRKLGFGNLN